MELYKSGFIIHRNRKIPIIWNGEHAQHIAEEHIKEKSSHPLLHIRIHQLAKNIKIWDRINPKSRKTRRYNYRHDQRQTFFGVIEIWSKFAYIITCYRK